MFTEANMQELVVYQSEAPVLSVFLNTDPSQGNAEVYKLHIRGMLKEVDLSKDVAEVENYFNRQYDWSGRSVAIFSCSNEGFFRAYSFAVPLRNRIRVSNQPHVKPLVDLLDHYGGYGVAIVDQQGARLFSIHLGEVREQEGVLGETVRHTKRGGAIWFVWCSKFIVFVVSSAFSQETAKAQTKIEQLFLAKGSLLVKEFYALEKKGLPGTVFFSWIILREVVKKSKEVSGLKVEITDYSRSVPNSESAFLDAEEVSELLSALDYLINLSNQCKSQPPSTHTETQFSTKGDFFVGFYCEGKDIKASLSAGRIGRVNSFFTVDKLPDFRALIEEASARFIK